MSLNMHLILNCDGGFDIGQMERLRALDPLVPERDPLGGRSDDRIPL